MKIVHRFTYINNHTRFWHNRRGEFFDFHRWIRRRRKSRTFRHRISFGFSFSFSWHRFNISVRKTSVKSHVTIECCTTSKRFLTNLTCDTFFFIVPKKYLKKKRSTSNVFFLFIIFLTYKQRRFVLNRHKIEENFHRYFQLKYHLMTLHLLFSQRHFQVNKF